MPSKKNNNNNNRRRTNKRRSRPPRSNNRANPAPAYRGEQTYKHVFQSVYALGPTTTPGGLVEVVNLGVLDDYAPIAATFAKWRLNSFSLRIMPTASTPGAYAVRIFENTGAGLPVVPTDLGAVMVAGGKMKACTNDATNQITLRYRRRDPGMAIYNPVSSLSDGDFGDPGWIFFVQGGTSALPSEFYAFINGVFEFRDFAQEATFVSFKRSYAIRRLPLIPPRIMDAPRSSEPVDDLDEDFIELVRSVKLHQVAKATINKP